jgi:hypothetical protein
MNSDDEMNNDYDGEAWWYVGRFMSSFATIEAGVDRALYELFDLDLILYSLLTSNLDLRKKLIFVRAAMEQQGLQDSAVAVVNKIHKLHDIRNMLAHSQFTISGEGIEFGYSGKQPGSEKFEAKEKTYLGHFISYSQLDSYEKEMSHIEDDASSAVLAASAAS